MTTIENNIRTKCTRNHKTASVILFGVQQALRDNTQHNTTSSPPILKSFFEQSLFDKNVLSIVFQFVPVIERCTCDNPKCLYVVYNTDFNDQNHQQWTFKINQVFVVKDTQGNECYAVVNNVIPTHIYVHYIEWRKHWDAWIPKTSPRINAIEPNKTQFNRINDVHQRLCVYNPTLDDREKMSIVKKAHQLFLNH
jgi:hypothetical protein